MGHFKVRYRLGKHKEYVYPARIAGVVWNSVAYHASERVMVGETDADIKADGREIVVLKPQEAKMLVEKYASSYPKPKKLPPGLLPDFLNADAGKR